MDVDKFLTWFFGSILNPLITSIVVGILYVIWGKISESWSWPTIFLRGLLTVAAVMLIFYVISSYRAGYIPRNYDPDEIEAKTKMWLEELGFMNRRVVEDKESNFHYLATVGGVSIDVLGVKQYKALILFQTRIIIDPTVKDKINKLSERNRKELIFLLRDKMLSIGISYEGLEEDLKEIKLMEAMAYSPSLSSLPFASALAKIQYAAKLLMNTFELETNRFDALVKAQ